MRAQTLHLSGEGQGHGLVLWETLRCHGSKVPALLIKLPSACGHHVPARPPKCPLLIHESTHMWLSLASTEALKHEKWGEILSVSEHLTLYQTPPTPPPPHPRQCALEENPTETDTDTPCCETLIDPAAVCLQLNPERCRSRERVCV